MSTHSQLFSPAGEPHFSLEGLRLPDPIPAGRRREHVPPLIDLDGANIFVMVMSLLFVAQMATYSAVLFTLAVIVYALRHRGSLREVLRVQGFFLLFPAYAVLSTLWSGAPADTLKHSLEFLLTVVAALLVTQARNRRAVMFALFGAFAVYSLASLLFGGMVHVGTTGTVALSGLADSKNEEATTVTTGAIIALAWFFIGLKTRSFLQSGLAAVVLAVEIYSALLAKSAGAMAALGVGIMTFLLLAALIKGGRRLRVAVVGFGGISALTLTMIFLIFTGPIIDAVSSWFGKDVTLTGRTYLWTRARDLIMEHPIFGQGFAAFWQQGNLDAEGLWQFAHIASRSGFNFHNTSYDILVSLGWIGLTLFMLTLIVGMVKMAAAYVRRPSLLAAFWLAMGASMVARLPVETMGTYEFSFATILLFAMFGYAAKAKELNARRESQSAREASGWTASPLPAGSYAP